MEREILSLGNPELNATAFAHQIGVIYEYDRIVYHYAGKGYDSDSGHNNDEVHPENGEPNEYTYGAEEHRCHDDKRRKERIELGYDNQKYTEEGNDQGPQQKFTGFCLFFLFSGEFDVVPFRQLEIAEQKLELGDNFIGVIACSYVGINRDYPAQVFSSHRSVSRGILHIGYCRDGDFLESALVVAKSHPPVDEGIDVISVLIHKTELNRVFVFTFLEFGYFLSEKCCTQL